MASAPYRHTIIISHLLQVIFDQKSAHNSRYCVVLTTSASDPARKDGIFDEDDQMGQYSTPTAETENSGEGKY
jgi:hypothetical protein